MLKRFMLLIAVTLLAGCAGTKVTDFTDRSLVYGWLDIEEINPNRINYVSIRQFKPKVEEPYYFAETTKFKDGILYYTWILPNGAHKAVSMQGRYCLVGPVFCSDTIYTYSLGKQDDEVGAVIIKNPGVYHLGSYKLKDVKVGFFEGFYKPATFEVLPATNAPSKREMLEEILKDGGSSVPPLIADRIKAELAKIR